MNPPAALYQNLVCPACTAPGLESAGERVVCSYCGTVIAQARAFCLNCHNINRPRAEYCERCGDPLTRACPSCHGINWVGAERCDHCGQPLDILEYLYRRHSQTTAETLHQARQEARVLKEHEYEAAERRSASLWAMERLLQKNAADAAARQVRREQAIIQWVLIGIAVIITIFVVAGLILTAR